MTDPPLTNHIPSHSPILFPHLLLSLAVMLLLSFDRTDLVYALQEVLHDGDKFLVCDVAVAINIGVVLDLLDLFLRQVEVEHVARQHGPELARAQHTVLIRVGVLKDQHACAEELVRFLG